jgi:hypothetical protein
MASFNEFVAFIRSTSEHFCIDEDRVFEIMRADDPDFACNHYGAEYTVVMDAHNVWNDAKRFFKP